MMEIDFNISEVIKNTKTSVHKIALGEGLPLAFLFAFAGLGVFLVTIRFLSSSLQTVTGPTFKKFLILFSDKPFIGIIFGIVFTTVIQSSDGAVALIIGLLAARLIKLKGAIAFLLGANIGTATTSIIVAVTNEENEAIKIISTSLTVFTFIGAIIMILAKKNKTAQYALVIFSIGAIFVGLKLLSAGAKVITKEPVFKDIINSVTGNVWLATLTSSAFTGIFQSSSATVAIYQNLYGTFKETGVNFEDAKKIIILSSFIALIIGSNIGTTLTGLIVAFSSGNRNAKRIAFLWGITNISMAIFILAIIRSFSSFVFSIDSRIGDAFQLSIAHILFNTILVLIFMWLIDPLAKLSKFIIKDKKHSALNYRISLPHELLDQPYFAIEASHKAVYTISELSYHSLKLLNQYLNTPNRKLKEEYNDFQQFIKDAREQLNIYLISLGSKIQDVISSRKHVSLLLTTRSLERISALGDVILEESAKNLNSKKEFKVGENIISEFKELNDICALMMKKATLQLNNYRKERTKEIKDLNHNLEVLVEQLLETFAYRTKGNEANILSLDYPIVVKTYERISHHIERVNNYWKQGRSRKRLRRLPNSIYFELKNN